MHSQGKSRTHNPPPARSHLSVSTTGIGIPFLLSEPPTPRETHSWDTHPHGRDPRDKTWIREMTPLLNLGYLVDDLEHSKDTTKGQMRHAHTPTQSTQCSPLSVGSMERTVHKAHAMKAKQHLLHQKTSDFSDAPTQDRGPNVRARGCTQPLLSSSSHWFPHSPQQAGGKTGQRPHGQTKKSRHHYQGHSTLLQHSLGSPQKTQPYHINQLSQGGAGGGIAKTITRRAHL